MKKLAIKDENNLVSIVTPVPEGMQETKDAILVEEVPTYNYETERLDIANKKLVVVPLTEQELNRRKEETKRFTYAQIDKGTQEEILKGFTFDNNTFSLSPNAQLNWQRIQFRYLQGEFKELEIATKDDLTYLLTESNVKAFLSAGDEAINEALKRGRDRKN